MRTRFVGSRRRKVRGSKTAESHRGRGGEVNESKSVAAQRWNVWGFYADCATRLICHYSLKAGKQAVQNGQNWVSSVDFCSTGLCCLFLNSFFPPLTFLISSSLSVGKDVQYAWLRKRNAQKNNFMEVKLKQTNKEILIFTPSGRKMMESKENRRKQRVILCTVWQEGPLMWTHQCARYFHQPNKENMGTECCIWEPSTF